MESSLEVAMSSLLPWAKRNLTYDFYGVELKSMHKIKKPSPPKYQRFHLTPQLPLFIWPPPLLREHL